MTRSKMPVSFKKVSGSTNKARAKKAQAQGRRESPVKNANPRRRHG